MYILLHKHDGVEFVTVAEDLSELSGILTDYKGRDFAKTTKDYKESQESVLLVKGNIGLIDFVF